MSSDLRFLNTPSAWHQARLDVVVDIPGLQLIQAPISLVKTNRSLQIMTRRDICGG